MSTKWSEVLSLRQHMWLRAASSGAIPCTGKVWFRFFGALVKGSNTQLHDMTGAPVRMPIFQSSDLAMGKRTCGDW